VLGITLGGCFTAQSGPFESAIPVSGLVCNGLGRDIPTVNQIRTYVVQSGGRPLYNFLVDLIQPDVSLRGIIIPLAGVVEIDDVADMVAFIASDAARDYHGAFINIDNGITVG
jgi:NAD(P)-dependent dehydrogenase (short-subunit alcohol dehydrogenase family)